jgi:molybdenum-dependent DNA-binding transcriptional regulator ModE
MTRVELHHRIDKAARKIAHSYQKSLKEVQEVKTKINDLELAVMDGGSAKSNRLKFALDSLIQLTDSITFESGRAWEEYEKLEQECKVEAYEPPEMNDLRGLCKKTEEFATDLLCYSLAHFKRGAYQDS